MFAAMRPKPMRPAVDAAQSQHWPSGRAPVPATSARRRCVLENTPKQNKPQGDGVVGDFVEAIVGDVGHHHAVLIGSLDIDDVDADPIATDRLAPLELGDRLARNTGILLENDVRVGGLFGKTLACATLQADDLRPDRFEYTALDVQIGIVVVTDIHFKFSHAGYFH